MTSLKLTLLLTSLVALPGLTWLTAPGAAFLEETDPADTLYRAGQKAIDEKKWSQAIDLFEQCVVPGNSGKGLMSAPSVRTVCAAGS